MKVTRRKLGRMLAAAPMVAAAISPVAIPAAAISEQAPAASDEETQSARDQLRNNARQLATVKLPMATEPACHFKA